MYNLYKGNSGTVRRVGEPKKAAPAEQRDYRIPQPQRNTNPPAASNPLSKIAEMLPNTLAELETEDILLMLILYLMYRESGDSELLIIMGAMFLL